MSESSLRIFILLLQPLRQLPPSVVALLLLPFMLQPDNKERDVFSRQVFAGLFLLSTGAEKWKTLCLSPSVCRLHRTPSLHSCSVSRPPFPTSIHPPCRGESGWMVFYKAGLAVTLDRLSFVNKTKSCLDLLQHKAIWGLNLGQREAGLIGMYNQLIQLQSNLSIPTSDIRKPF